MVCEVLAHGKQKAIGIFLRRYNGRLILIGQLLVLILNALHEVVGPHEINNAHPQLPLMLDHQERVVNHLVLAQEVHVLL